MTGPNLSEIYFDLLRRENQKTLIDAANEIFAKVVADSVKARLIVAPDDLDVELPSDLTKTGGLFGRSFVMTEALGSEEVRYSSLGHQFERNRARLAGNPDNLFRRRSQMVPALYSTLRQHRNIIAHEPDAGTEPRIIGLCGTIMCILELAPSGAERLRIQCVRAVANVAREMEKQHQRDVEEREVEGSEAGAHDSENDKEPDEAIDAQHERVPLESQRRRPTLTLPRGKRARDLRLERIDEGVRSLASRLENIDTVSDSGLAVGQRIARELDELRETVSHGRRKVLLYEDEVMDEIPDYEVEGQSYSDDKPMLTVSMAKEKLRALRDRIEREHKVKSWENICMIVPIVNSALRVASVDGLADIDDWRQLPEVRDRYSRHSDTMDRQIKAFGDDMMGVYRRVESTEDL